MISINDAEEILKKEYVKDNYFFLINNILLPDFIKDEHIVLFENHCFENVTYFGCSEKCESSVFEVLLKEDCQNKRVLITQEMFKILKKLRINNAIVSFVNEDKKNYRISLLTSKYQIEDDKIVKVLSNPRRYSYSLGYGTKTKTAFKYLISKGPVDDLNDLVSRFSVEVVNKQFYLEIASLFTELIGGERNNKIYPRTLCLKNVKDNNKYAEFGVRLIGRLMFCWFLREKRSVNDIPLVPDIYFDEHNILKEESYYHSVLEPLFFELLNTNHKNRKQEYRDNFFEKIPYLNGGLFSPHIDDLYHYDSSTKLGKTDYVVIPNEWFVKFYTILNQYNFTVDENTSYDVELSIDPELLGRIFENFLAEINPQSGDNAKKNTGSFYTPREIVDYMVDNSIVDYLFCKTGIDKTRLFALVNYSKDEENEFVFNEKEISKIIDSLYKITVLDPACGSGAFPIGMLQKIVYVLQEIDPSANLWLKKTTDGLNPVIRKEIENKFSIGSLNYIRKLSVIQNSIFGIDIQSIAVEISRLRCFLSLIIEEKVDDNDFNRGINPLPNLDFKFIIANSLLGLDKRDSTSLFQNDDYIVQLKEVRDDYFNADNESRKDLKLTFATIQQNMLIESVGGFASKKYYQLSAWKPFSNEPTDWFDADWMFGIKNGFDIVIGNPPYIDSETMTKTMKRQREEYTKCYEVAKGNWDIFLLFIEMAIKNIKDGGNTTFILPNKLIGANYAKATRNFMSKYNFVSLRDYSDVQVFEASVYPVVYLLSKSKNYGSCLIEKMETLNQKYFEKTIDQKVFTDNDNWDSFFKEKSIASDIIAKMNKFKKIGEFAFVRGAATVGEAYDIQPYILNCETFDKNMFKFVNTGTIDRYKITWEKDKTQYLKQFYYKPVLMENDVGKILPNRLTDCKNEKIVIGGMCKTLECYYDSGICFAGKSTTIISDSNLSLKCLTGILNSKLVSYFYFNNFSSLSLQGGFLRFGPPQIKLIPVPIDKLKSSGIETQIENLVDKIIECKDDSNISSYENEIDQIVYSLYNLTDDEKNEVTHSR